MWLPVVPLLAIVLLVGVASCTKPLPIDDDELSSQLYSSHHEILDETIESRAGSVAFRLPNNTRPTAYSIHLRTRVDTQTDFTFTGTVAITLQGVGGPSNTITLNHRQLTIKSARLVRKDQPDAAIPLVEPPVYTEENEFLTYTLAGASQITDQVVYVLTIEYAGELRTDDAGFYRSSYISASGEKRWLATTQFESTDARHAFPCYDEPALRAQFTIKITHGSTYHAISNMPVDGTPLVE